MNTDHQIAAKAWSEILAYDDGIVGKQSPIIDKACIAIIKSAIEKATKEHQDEHDRLQAIIEKDTMALMVEKEKSRVLGKRVDGLRAAWREGYLKGDSDCSKAYMALNESRAAHAREPVTDNDAEQLARTFHEIYERFAPHFGYETRKETREFEPTTPNGRLMIAVCRELLSEPWRRKPAAHASEP